MKINPEYHEFNDSQKIGLCRPEAIAFSPDGAHCAVANSEANSIVIYRTRAESDGFDMGPWRVIHHNSFLRYVHGIAFSADGKHLATAARESHTLAWYAVNGPSGSEPADVQSEPEWWLSGQEFGLRYPASVAVHPSGNYLVVGNRSGEYAYSFYRRVRSGYGFMPDRSVTREELLVRDLSTPHDICFDREGKRLFSCNTPFYREPPPNGGSALLVFGCDEHGLQKDEFRVSRFDSSLMAHSIDLHPDQTHFAMTDLIAGTRIFQVDEQRGTLDETDFLPWVSEHSEHGVKGAAFSRDGRRLNVVNAENAILSYTITGSS